MQTVLLALVFWHETLFDFARALPCLFFSSERYFNSGVSAREAPWVRKIGNPSS